jgi:PTS system ascorbate-specific IIA component
MSVGVLLITHEGIGGAIAAAAKSVMHSIPLQLAVFEVPWDFEDRERQANALRLALCQLDEGDGVLVLVDIFGATPFNMLVENDPGCTTLRVSGLNLPMLLRVLNYPEKNLRELAEAARDGGKAGVVMDG